MPAFSNSLGVLRKVSSFSSLNEHSPSPPLFCCQIYTVSKLNTALLEEENKYIAAAAEPQ